MDYINNIYWAYRNKITNKLWGVVSMPATGKKKGSVLISYFTEPFTLAPWEHFSNLHTMYWECYEIARLFSSQGYAVDVINWNNRTFTPRKQYKVCVDTQGNLERLNQTLPKECRKVMHIVTTSPEFQNTAEKKRLDELKNRRGVALAPRRQVPMSNNVTYANFLEGFGNKTVRATYANANKAIFPIPISAVQLFDFPEHKDFDTARKHFLWFGGGGAVLKGLDLTLEAFAVMPELHLHVCGPIYGEKDFVKEYKEELERTPNIHVYGRIDVASKQFADIINKCSAVVYPSGGEGSSGAVIQAMHAGLVPIITHETGIQEDSGYIPLENPTPESVAKAVKDFSNMPAKDIEEFSKKIWNYVRKRYTRKTFSDTYKCFIEEKLKI